MTEWPDYQGYGYLAAIILIVPFIVSLVYSFRKFDIRPSIRRNLHFLKYFLPLLVFCFFLSSYAAYLGFNFPYFSYHLTQDNKLVEGGYYLKVYDGKNVKKSVRGDYFYYIWSALDAEDFFIFQEPNFDGKLWIRKIFRMDLNSSEIKLLYKSRNQKRPYTPWSMKKFENKVVFLEAGPGESEAEFVSVNYITGEVTQAGLKHSEFSDTASFHIFGTDILEGKRFWLITFGKKGHPVLQFWEDGRVEFLGNSRRFPMYVNQTLFLYEKDLVTFFKLNTSGIEQIGEAPGLLLFHSIYYRSDVSPILLKDIYGVLYDRKNGNKPIRLNLENFEVTELKSVQGRYPDVHYAAPGRFYLLEHQKKNWERNLYIIDENELRLLKNFKVDNLKIFYSGVVAKKKGRVKVYTFPDLKRLKFKKLR
jgi:hypothetical protein